MRETKTVHRRAFSEAQLAEVLPHDLTHGYSYHVISGGDIDSLSYLAQVLRRQSLDYCLLSTWCMADDDVLQIREWLAAGKIKRLDCYLGEIFPSSYLREYATLKEVMAEFCPSGRIAIFRNHSKIYAGSGPRFSFAIESSANINTNPRTEQTTLTLDLELYKFYKNFFDGIKPFNHKDHPSWIPHPA